MKRRRISSYLIAGAILASSTLFTSCKSDSENVDELVGTYAFTSANLAAAVNISLDGTNISPLPAGESTYAAQFVVGGLYDTAPCTSPTSARTQLRADGSSWYVCVGESAEKQQGSWEINSARTDLTLTVSGDNTSTGQPIAVIISGVTFNGTTLSGTITNFPMVKNVAFDLGASIPTGYAYEGTANYQAVQINITFTKVTF